jgi:hypothetical protein
MVPPQPRLPVRRTSRVGRAGGLTAAAVVLAVVLVVALGPVLPAPLKELAARLPGLAPARRLGARSPAVRRAGGLTGRVRTIDGEVVLLDEAFRVLSGGECQRRRGLPGLTAPPRSSHRRAGRRPYRLGGRLRPPPGSRARPRHHRQWDLPSPVRCGAWRVRLRRARRAARLLLCTRRSNSRPRSGGILRLRGGVKPGHFWG